MQHLDDVSAKATMDALCGWLTTSPSSAAGPFQERQCSIGSLKGSPSVKVRMCPVSCYTSRALPPASLGAPAGSLDGMQLVADSLMVMDMGQHVLKDLSVPMQLHQILVPGLEVGPGHETTETPVRGCPCVLRDRLRGAQLLASGASNVELLSRALVSLGTRRCSSLSTCMVQSSPGAGTPAATVQQLLVADACRRGPGCSRQSQAWSS